MSRSRKKIQAISTISGPVLSVGVTFRLAHTIAAVAALILAGVVVYAPSLHGGFLFDDEAAIVGNPAIQQLWPPWVCMFSEWSFIRPIVNLTLAVNFALGGANVTGYHVFNAATHLLAALVLFGIVRRTMMRVFVLPPLGQGTATWLGFWCALLWLLHPLQTQAVNYIVQRSETLMGLFYLLTLYCVIRGAETAEREKGRTAEREKGRRGERENGETTHERSRVNGGDLPLLPLSLSPLLAAGAGGASSVLWYSLAIVCCATGMGCKPVMVTAPILVLLYDRMFLAGSFTLALRRRWILYAALAGTWLILGALLACSPPVLSAGFQGTKYTPVQYLLSQAGVILHYLYLSVWPVRLCFDYYDWPAFKDVVPGLIVCGAVAGLSIWGLRRRAAWGFAGAWFFIILAPTSSFMPIEDLVVEHRMYLSLAAVVVVLICGGYGLLQARLLSAVPAGTTPALQRRALIGISVVALMLALAEGFMTVRRHADYQTKVTLWRDAAAKRPDNVRAHSNLAEALLWARDYPAAQIECERALELEPGPAAAAAQYNLAEVLTYQKQHARALEHFEAALAGKLDFVTTDFDPQPRVTAKAAVHCHCGLALNELHRPAEAIPRFEEALKLAPVFPAAHYGLGRARMALNQIPEAIEQFKLAVAQDGRFVEAYCDWGAALVQAHQYGEAETQYQAALRIRPGYLEAHNDLGSLYFETQRYAAAAEQFKMALALKDDLDVLHFNLGLALLRLKRFDEACAQFRAVLHLRPSNNQAQFNLGLALWGQGQFAEALGSYREAVRLWPDAPELLRALARALAACPEVSLRNGVEALTFARKACALTHDQDPESLDSLAIALAEQGDYTQAAAVAQKAIDLARAAQRADLIAGLEQRLALYQKHIPFHEEGVQRREP